MTLTSVCATRLHALVGYLIAQISMRCIPVTSQVRHSDSGWYIGYCLALFQTVAIKFWYITHTLSVITISLIIWLSLYIERSNGSSSACLHPIHFTMLSNISRTTNQVRDFTWTTSIYNSQYFPTNTLILFLLHVNEPLNKKVECMEMVLCLRNV